MKYKIFMLTALVSLNYSTFAVEPTPNEKEAIKTIQKFGKKLRSELQKGMKKSPIEAIKVCSIEAPQIANEVQTSEIEIGRVSLKNRNKNNTPKEWMLPTINAYHAKKNTNPITKVELGNGKMGIIKPITTASLCLNCHGTKISKDVQAKIKELYPNDKATGYSVGDIRGFFWVTYPKDFPKNTLVINEKLKANSYKNIYTAPAITADDIQALKKKGFDTIVSLRFPEEYDTTEIEEQISKNNMSYLNIPTSGGSPIDKKSIEKLKEIIKTQNGKNILIHCSSANRAGMLAAAIIHDHENLSIKQTTELAKALGVTKNILLKNLNNYIK